MAQSVEKPERHKPESATKRVGIGLERYFTQPGVNPFSQVEWETRSGLIAGEDGHVVFEPGDVDAPRGSAQTPAHVVVSKYFRCPPPSPPRDRSTREIITRLVA